MRSTDEDYMFRFIGRNKIKLRPHQLCQGPLKSFQPFVEEVYTYDFDTKPNYDKLHHLMCKQLLEHDVKPNMHFDWSNWRPVSNDRSNEIEVESAEENLDEDVK